MAKEYILKSFSSQELIDKNGTLAIEPKSVNKSLSIKADFVKAEKEILDLADDALNKVGNLYY